MLWASFMPCAKKMRIHLLAQKLLIKSWWNRPLSMFTTLSLSHSLSLSLSHTLTHIHKQTSTTIFYGALVLVSSRSLHMNPNALWGRSHTRMKKSVTFSCSLFTCTHMKSFIQPWWWWEKNCLKRVSVTP